MVNALTVFRLFVPEAFPSQKVSKSHTTKAMISHTSQKSTVLLPTSICTTNRTTIFMSTTTATRSTTEMILPHDSESSQSMTCAPIFRFQCSNFAHSFTKRTLPAPETSFQHQHATQNPESRKPFAHVNNPLTKAQIIGIFVPVATVMVIGFLYVMWRRRGRGIDRRVLQRTWLEPIGGLDARTKQMSTAGVGARMTVAMENLVAMKDLARRTMSRTRSRSRSRSNSAGERTKMAQPSTGRSRSRSFGERIESGRPTVMRSRSSGERTVV